MDMTQALLKALVIYYPETGEFRIKEGGGGRQAMSIIGYESRGYLRASLQGNEYSLHILAVLYMTGEWPTGVVAHKDDNKQNNVWTNLADVTQAVNLQMSRNMGVVGKTGYKGVSLHKKSGLYLARININNRQISLGYHTTPELAAAAYEKAKAANLEKINGRQNHRRQCAANCQCPAESC